MPEQKDKITINFDSGTLVIDGGIHLLSPIEHLITYDKRTKNFRANACDYSQIILKLRSENIAHIDNAKQFKPIEVELTTSLQPRYYQKNALTAWLKSGFKGITSLPTGSGKSFLAMMAIDYIKRPTLIIVPTIDLMHQWGNQLKNNFGIEPGYLGGGFKEPKDITVSTYDSAVLHMEFIGNKYAFMIFDECHHLPGPTNRMSALMSIAPYRLGLSATPPEEEDLQKIMTQLIGPIIFNVSINELKGKVLSSYNTQKVYIKLTEDEQKEYDTNRRIYLDFLRSSGIDFSKQDFWQKFIALCCRTAHGKKVYKSYLRQKEIARSSQNKIKAIWHLIKKHNNESTIIFTADNDTAYKLGTLFYLPVITHKTKPAERKFFLNSFRSGEYHILVTSKVLNEGIDVPEANVGIVVSGSGSIREHVQRLGRILRPSKNKQAILYEIISMETNEEKISIRRRNHKAYSPSH